MNDNYPEPGEMYQTQGKLVLPAYDDTNSPPGEDAQTAFFSGGQAPYSPYNPPVNQQPMGRYGPPINPLDRPPYRKRTDSAHLILVIAIVVVLVAAGSLAAMAAVLYGPSLVKGSATTGKIAATASNTHPSPTALPSPSPTVLQTLTPQATASPTSIVTTDGQPLSLTLLDLPQEVNNNSSVPVTVQTNAPGVQVQLQVTYAAPPDSYNSDTQVTDANGVATLTWNVQIFPSKRKTTAHVIAVGQDQNGQQVQSQQVSVRVLR